MVHSITTNTDNCLIESLIATQKVLRDSRNSSFQTKWALLNEHINAVKKVVNDIKSSGNTQLITAVVSSLCGFTGGLAPFAGPRGYQLLTNASLKTVQNLSKTVSSTSEAFGRTYNTYQDKDRTSHQAEVEKLKTLLDELTRKMDDDQNTSRNFNSSAEEVIRAAREAHRLITQIAS